MVLTSIQPCAWMDTRTKCGGELKSTILPLSPTQAPSPWIWLFQSDDSPDTQGHCHHYHCAPEQEMLQQSWAASSMDLKLRTFCRQRTLLQPPCPHAMTTGTLTCWCCCFRHGQTLKLAFMAQLTSSTSSPPLQDRPNTKISLGVMWLFWVFYILDVLWEENAECNPQSTHAFTSILYQLME